ncbi:MAG: hypothetical protein ACSHX6_15095 [Akkermansiaceae bacterium]
MNPHQVPNNIDWIIVDGIGPFFKGYQKRKTNWSKIPLADLPITGPKANDFWLNVREDMLDFVQRVKAEGYNSITLDDIAHVTPLDEHNPTLLARIHRLRSEIKQLIHIIKSAGLRVLMTTDVVPMSPETERRLHGNRTATEDYFTDLLQQFITDFPEVDGIILRLGEGDGNDVKGQIRNELFVKTPKEANQLIQRLLPMFEKHNKVIICRTWTVGAHAIGDLIWNPRRIKQFLKEIHSDHFILSMKYGESDFFRYLPLSQIFFQTTVKKVIEFQARREYEGAGEYPNFIGFDVEKYADQLKQANNLVGLSVWVQTGGWHAFNRRSYIGKGSPWVELNSSVIVKIFRDRITARSAITKIVGKENQQNAIRFLELADHVVSHALYIKEFSEQEWFFRRVRIPPLIHVYWDCVFFYHPVKKALTHFVKDKEKAIAEANQALLHFPEMLSLADSLKWNTADVHFMHQTFKLFALAREYYFTPFTPAMKKRVNEAKDAYKKQFPNSPNKTNSERPRFRIKIDYRRFPVSHRKLAILQRLFIRNNSKYRMTDHVVTLRLLGILYRFFSKKKSKLIPKFLRKSAMGVDSLFH